jgi:cell division protein FtsL
MKKNIVIIATICVMGLCVFLLYDIRGAYQRKKRFDELNDSLNKHMENARKASQEVLKALEKTKKIRKDTIKELPKNK